MADSRSDLAARLARVRWENRQLELDNLDQQQRLHQMSPAYVTHPYDEAGARASSAVRKVSARVHAWLPDSPLASSSHRLSYSEDGGGLATAEGIKRWQAKYLPPPDTQADGLHFSDFEIQADGLQFSDVAMSSYGPAQSEEGGEKIANSPAAATSEVSDIAGHCIPGHRIQAGPDQSLQLRAEAAEDEVRQLRRLVTAIQQSQQVIVEQEQESERLLPPPRPSRSKSCPRTQRIARAPQSLTARRPWAPAARGTRHWLDQIGADCPCGGLVTNCKCRHASVVEQHAKDMVDHFSARGIRLPLSKLVGQTFQLGKKQVHLIAKGKKLVARTGGGFVDFIDLLQKQTF